MSNLKSTLTKSEILSKIGSDGVRVHFCGVGGVSMSSLFCLSRHFGISCSGSDSESSPFLEFLIKNGENIYIGEREELEKDVSLLVYSHAVSKNDSKERKAAEKEGIPEVSRAEYLGALMTSYDQKVGVSGSHGKSTVTAMIAKIFSDAEKKPTVLSGAQLFASHVPFHIGSLDYLIYEACEYKDSFLSFEPDLSIFLNAELDHVDYFKNVKQLEQSFGRAMRLAKRIIINSDDKSLVRIANESKIQFRSCGRSDDAYYRYEILSDEARKMSFLMHRNGVLLGTVNLPMLGSFNMGNAAIAVAAALEYGIPFASAAESLSVFHGIGRRLEQIGKYKGRDLFYDYAHHPSEIKASIEAIRRFSDDKVTVVFRPHTFTRTKGLWHNFQEAFKCADYTVLLDICGVREKEIAGVSSELLASQCGAQYCIDVEKIAENIDKTEGAIILMGAADLDAVRNILTN